MNEGSRFFKLACYTFLVTSTFGFLQPFLPLYLVAAGLRKDEIGLVTGIAAGLALIVQPLIGRLSDKMDARRPFVFVSALAAAIAFFALPYANGLAAFTLLCAVGANGTMYLNAAGGVLVGRLVKAAQGGAAYGGIRLWGSVGYIFTSTTSGLLIALTASPQMTRADLNPVFHFGPLALVAVAALAFVVPDAKSEREAGAPAEKAPMTPNLQRFLAAYFLYVLALYGASGFLSIYLKDLGSPAVMITLAFSAGVLIEVMVMRWSGRFSDEYGRRPALAITFCLLPIRLALYTAIASPWWVMAVQSLHGLNFGIMGAVAVVFINDLATERTRGHAQGRLFAASGLASAVGPPILGWAAQAWSLPAMFLVAAVIGLGGALLFVFGVDDSLPGSKSLSDALPNGLRRMTRWLDARPAALSSSRNSSSFDSPH